MQMVTSRKGIGKDKVMNQYEMTDRYKMLEMPYPDPKTMCEGQCDGTGTFPVHVSEENLILKAEWNRLHNESHRLIECLKAAWFFIRRGEFKIATTCFEEWGKSNCDGWHFITCPDCKGTGLKEVEDVGVQVSTDK